MMRYLPFVVAALVAGGAVLACGSSSDCSIPAGSTINVTRANGAGACPASVTAGVTALNGNDTFMNQKEDSCGVTHFTLTVNFINTDTSHETCAGMETISFSGLTATGGTGTESMAITCPSGVSCTETYDVTWATK